MTGASLRLRLQVSGDDRLISGTMFGHAIADQGGVSVDVFGDTSTDAALVSGRVDAASVQGMIIGQVLFDGAGLHHQRTQLDVDATTKRQIAMNVDRACPRSTESPQP